MSSTYLLQDVSCSNCGTIQWAKTNGWVKLLSGKTWLDGLPGWTQGSTTCFLLLDLASPMSHWLNVAMQCSSVGQNYGIGSTWDDTASMLTQIEELKSFIAEVATSSGKGPSSMICDRVDKGTQVHAVKAYTAEFTNKHAQQEVTEENTNR